MPFIDLHCDTLSRLLADRRAGGHDTLRAGPGDLASVELVTVPVSDHRNPVGAFHGPVVGDRYCLDIYPGSPENIHCGKGLYLLEALSEK